MSPSPIFSLFSSFVSSVSHPPCLFFVVLCSFAGVVRQRSEGIQPVLSLCLCVLGGVILAEWGVGAGLAGGNAGLGTVKGASLAPPGPLPAAPWEKYPQQRLACE